MINNKSYSNTIPGIGAILIDECVDGLSKTFSDAAVADGIEIFRAKNNFSGTDEKDFMPGFLEQREKVMVFTTNKTDFNSFISPKCCVVTLTNSNMEAQEQDDLIKRLFMTQPFRSFNNFFSLGRVEIEKSGRVRYFRHGKEVSKPLSSPHPHNIKPFTLSIKL